jgi:putative ABC transport system permease protein
MRIAAIDGRRAKDILVDPRTITPDWTLRREYRSTFRERLSSTEEVLEGTFVGDFEGAGPMPISVEGGLAEKLHLRLGSRITFDVQGTEIETTIGSIRKVEWQRLQSNFFFVFPRGTLEGAPQMYILSTRGNSPAERAHIQQLSANDYPNISSFDLESLVSTADEILRKFIALVVLLSGSVCVIAFASLLSATLSSTQQRLREQALLNVLGAGRSRLLLVFVLEYLFVGVLAVVAGTILAWAASKLVVTEVLKLHFRPALGDFLYPSLGALSNVLIIAVLSALFLFRIRPLILMRE